MEAFIIEEIRPSKYPVDLHQVDQNADKEERSQL